MVYQHLLRLVRSAVGQVVGGIQQWHGIIEVEIRQQVQAMIDEVVGGIWVGEGATRFVEELNTIVIPDTDCVLEACTDYVTAITSSVGVIDNLENEICSIVGNLETVYPPIYPE